MANPLMKGMLNNILVKAGRKTEAAPEAAYGSNLKKEQEKLLVSNILKAKASTSYKHDYEAFNKTTPGMVAPNMVEANMVTLEDLRGNRSSEKTNKAEHREEKANSTMVTLASIGKLNKR